MHRRPATPWRWHEDGLSLCPFSLWEKDRMRANNGPCDFHSRGRPDAIGTWTIAMEAKSFGRSIFRRDAPLGRLLRSQQNDLDMATRPRFLVATLLGRTGCGGSPDPIPTPVSPWREKDRMRGGSTKAGACDHPVADSGVRPDHPHLDPLPRREREDITASEVQF